MNIKKSQKRIWPQANAYWLPVLYFLCLSFLLFPLILPAQSQSGDAYLKEGYELYITGSYQEALDYYGQALSLSPGYAPAYYWKAKCYIKLKDPKSAVESLKKTLELEPDHWGAKYLLTTLKKHSLSDLPLAGNLTLEFYDTKISKVIYMFAKETGLNLVPAKGLRGSITLALNDVSAEEALKAILETAQAKIVHQGNLLKVVPLIEQPQVVDMARGSLAKTYKIDYVSPDQIVTALTNLLPEAEVIEMVEDTKHLIVQGPTSVIRRADVLIRNLDAPPKQVVVEAKVIEIRATDASNLGLDLKITNPNDANDLAQTKGLAGKITDSNPQGFYAQVISTNLESYLSTLASETDFNLVASPRITAISGKPASILIGAKYGYKTAIITETSTTQQIEFLEVGTSLTITPYVTKDRFIIMKVEPKVSEGQVVDELPQENTTETASEVMVKDGQTIVIGGLIKDKEVLTDIGIPFLMDIPFLGALFRKTTTSIEKTELLVFVTPHILSPEKLTDMAREAAEMQEKSRQHKARLIH